MALSSPLNNIILTGFMGCGKNYLSLRLSKFLRYKLYDTDKMIEKQISMKIKNIFIRHNEAYFRSLEHDIGLGILNSVRGSIISTGGGFPIYYEDILTLGTVIYMDIPLEKIVSRMSQKGIKKRPLFTDIKKAEALFNQREHIYKQRSHFQLNATQSVNNMIKDIKFFLYPLKQFNLYKMKYKKRQNKS